MQTSIAQTQKDVNSEIAFSCFSDDFPGNVFLTPDFVRHYRGAWVWPFPKPPMSKADIYGATLQADTYSEAVRDALRAGDDDGVRSALEVMLSIATVALSQLREPSSSENRVLQ